MDRLTRRRLLAALTAGVAVVAVGTPEAVGAQGVDVPVDLQVQLLAKIAAFDRNMASRAGDLVTVVVPSVSDEPESVQVARRIALHLSQLGSIVGRPVDVHVVEFTTVEALVEACQIRRASILYLTPGLRPVLASIGRQFEGGSILSVSAVAEHVFLGSAVSFSLSEGKPEILVHLGRARAQGVDFKASFLRLVAVVDT